MAKEYMRPIIDLFMLDDGTTGMILTWQAGKASFQTDISFAEPDEDAGYPEYQRRSTTKELAEADHEAARQIVRKHVESSLPPLTEAEREQLREQLRNDEQAMDTVEMIANLTGRSVDDCFDAAFAGYLAERETGKDKAADTALALILG